MEKDNDTFYCSFVSTHYIVCECGETFPTEEDLKEHLEKGHRTNKKEKVAVVKASSNVVAPKLLVYSDSQPLQINGRPFYIISSGKIKEEVFDDSVDEVLNTLEGHLEQHHAEEIKDEIIYELVNNHEVNNEEIKQEDIQELPEGLAEEDFTTSADLQDDDIPGKYVTVVTSNSYQLTDHTYDKDVRDKEYFCDLCGKAFGSEKAVRHHNYRMHQLTQEQRDQRSHVKKRVCEVCGRKYASQAALRYHQRVHTGEKPYACPECPKRFTMPLFLQIHVRTHTGERPYECPLCPKAFSNKAALLRHDRVHTGVKPYACAECGKTFSQSNSMKLHVRTVHLKLPTPYKSKARRLKALRRTAVAAPSPPETQEQVVYEVDGQVENYSVVGPFSFSGPNLGEASRKIFKN